MGSDLVQKDIHWGTNEGFYDYKTFYHYMRILQATLVLDGNGREEMQIWHYRDVTVSYNTWQSPDDMHVRVKLTGNPQKVSVLEKLLLEEASRVTKSS